VSILTRTKDRLDNLSDLATGHDNVVVGGIHQPDSAALVHGDAPVSVCVARASLVKIPGNNRIGNQLERFYRAGCIFFRVPSTHQQIWFIHRTMESAVLVWESGNHTAEEALRKYIRTLRRQPDLLHGRARLSSA
jgi:hypothetical protein